MNYGDIFKSDSNGLDFLSATDKFEINGYKVTSIPQNMVGKPWVMAEVEYGDFRLWWAIMKANGLRIPMIQRDTFRVREGKPNTDNIITDFYVGRRIILPSINDINAYVNKVTGV